MFTLLAVHKPLSTLGDILHLSHVQVQCDNTESRDRLLLLFPGLLVILSISPRLSGYTYQGKLPTSGLTVKAIEDADNYTNAFELSGSMVDQRIVSCATSQAQAEWVELLRQQAKLGPTRRISVKPQSLQVCFMGQQPRCGVL
ncbi:Rho guanine nucleotide exchange factor 7 [Lamellibrachia satsuma]|nr:Rho guanine nucleotide exchange factor 7 [Lamellibrachia satsuma]